MHQSQIWCRPSQPTSSCQSFTPQQRHLRPMHQAPSPCRCLPVSSNRPLTRPQRYVLPLTAQASTTLSSIPRQHHVLHPLPRRCRYSAVLLHHNLSYKDLEPSRRLHHHCLSLHQLLFMPTSLPSRHRKPHRQNPSFRYSMPLQGRHPTPFPLLRALISQRPCRLFPAGPQSTPNSPGAART